MIHLIKLTGLSLSFLIPSLSQAQQMYGLFMIVKGEVTFQNPNSPSEKAKVGAKVFEGATIKSEKDSRAKIVMSDRNVFNLSPDSKMTIQKYDATAGKKTVSLSLEEGKVRVNVEQKYDGNKEKFLLKTPTVVAGVRGTQFLGSYSSVTKTSQVVTFQGTVAMTSFNAAGQPLGTVKVEKGQSSSANPNQAPEAPKNVPKQELKDLDKSSASVGADRSAGSTGEKKEIKLATSGGSKDTDTDLAKEIKTAPPAGEKPPLPPIPPIQSPALIPKIPDTVAGIIQNSNSTTKVTIIVH